jgi:hypothetical protein
MLNYSTDFLPTYGVKIQEIEYGTKIEEIVASHIKKATEGYIGVPYSSSCEVYSSIVNQLYSIPFFQDCDVSQDELEPSKLHITYSILPGALGYMLLDPRKDDHKWNQIYNLDNDLLGFPTYKCKECGLVKIVHNGWTLSKLNLTCDEMIIKDIIE